MLLGRYSISDFILNEQNKIIGFCLLSCILLQKLDNLFSFGIIWFCWGTKMDPKRFALFFGIIYRYEFFVKEPGLFVFLEFVEFCFLLRNLCFWNQMIMLKIWIICILLFLKSDESSAEYIFCCLELNEFLTPDLKFIIA